MVQARLKYNTSLTVDLTVLAVHGIAEPDHLQKFPGIVHEMLDGSLAEQIAGARRCPSIDFMTMSALERRKVVKWWLDPAATVESLVGTPASVSLTLGTLGSLTNGSTYYYEIRAIDPLGGGVTTTAGGSQAVTTPDLSVIVSWAAVSEARMYAVYRKKDAGHWFLLDYITGTGFTDNGTGIYADGQGVDIGTGSPPSAADSIAIIKPDDLVFKWMGDNELQRMLTVDMKETSIFTSTDGFPV